MKIQLKCSYCGKGIEKYPSQIKNFNFCSRECANNFSNKTKNPERYKEYRDMTLVSKAVSETNRKLNSYRMKGKKGKETKEKIRQARLKTRNEKTGYYKLYGRHEHRIIAEQILGRKLRKGEVVHHIDGNKHNNNIDNLMILSNQSEHAKLHAKLRKEVIKTHDL